jgi:hypothetical protein
MMTVASEFLELALGVTPQALSLASGETSPLLAPLRLRVDKAQATCLEILAGLPDEAQGTILHDRCTDAVERLVGIPPCTRDVWSAVMDAENRRNGYDTWSAKELRAHIKAINGLHTAMVELSRAIWTLSDAERREVSSLLHSSSEKQPHYS